MRLLGHPRLTHYANLTMYGLHESMAYKSELIWVIHLKFEYAFVHNSLDICHLILKIYLPISDDAFERSQSSFGCVVQRLA